MRIMCPACECFAPLDDSYYLFCPYCAGNFIKLGINVKHVCEDTKGYGYGTFIGGLGVLALMGTIKIILGYFGLEFDDDNFFWFAILFVFLWILSRKVWFSIMLKRHFPNLVWRY